MGKTSLAEQLKKLQTPQTHLLKQSKERASFLFDRKEAANFDRDTIYELGLSGLEELKNLNPNFNAFDNTLFDVTSKKFERAVESTEANEKLNDQIKTFLTLLSPYFLLKPAHKALEWLINRYHIEKFNVDDLLFLILPYHETTHFAQMLQILKISKDTGRWHWLYQVKMQRIPLSKTALLNRAASDMSFLKFVCDMPAQAIKIHGSRGSCLNTLFAFYCTTVIGSLQHAQPIKELHITHILPSILTALSSAFIDYTASSFMIIARLATKTCLTPKIITVLFNKICKVEHAKLRSEMTLVLVLLCQNNDGKCELPEKAAGRLVDATWFIPCLNHINTTGVLINPFVLLLLTTCLRLVQNGEEKYRPLVENLLTQVKHKAEDVEDIFRVLLEEFNIESGEGQIQWYSQILKGLENSFPKLFDAVVSSALSDEESKAGVAVKTILGINTSRNDLFLKLVHPNEDIRVQAIKHIRKHFEPDQLAWLNQTLLDRLRDDSPKVIRQWLRLPLPLISSLQSDTLIQNLVAVVARFSESDEPIVLQALSVLAKNYTDDLYALLLIVLLPHLVSVMHKTKIIEESSGKNNRFLDELKSNSMLEIKAVTALWKTLSKADIIPSIENITTTMDKWNILKSHSSFWFSSSLLIASKMTENLVQETGELVMEFLIEYLKFPEVVSLDSIDSLRDDTLQSCLEVSSQSKLPIHGALHCLSVLSTAIRSHSAKKPWIDLDHKYDFSLSMFKVLHEGCESENKSIRVAFSNARSSFFETHFPEIEHQVQFLINTVILEPCCRVKCIDLAIKIMKENENLLSSCLKENSLVVPAFLVLTGSYVDSIRLKALEALSLFTDSLANGFYRPLIETLAEHSTEIKLDHEQIEIVMYKLLSPSPEVRNLRKKDVAKSVESILHHLIKIIGSISTPAYIKSSLLRILQLVTSKDILLELLPVASKYIGGCEVLDENQSKVVVRILNRLNETVTDILKEDKFWEFLTKALSDHKTVVLHSEYNKGTCPAALVLNQISKEFFENIPKPKEEIQEKLLTKILEKVTDADNIQVMNTNSSLFKRIILDGSMIVKLLKPMETVIVPLSPSTSLRARKRKSSSGILSLHTLETFDWKRGVCLLEVIQNKKQITNIHLLLPEFFVLLKKCLQFEEQAPVEYTKQLLLSSILHCCEKLQHYTDKSLVPDGLQVDVIVQCVRGSHNPQTHHHTLLALAYIAHLLPEQVLVNIMEIFTFIGSTILRQDDAYSIQLISKIVETVIPILVKSQKNTELEEGVTNVLRVFVAAIMHVPEHRRVPLFKKLLVSLNDGEYMWIFLCLVFEKHVLDFNTQRMSDGSISETQKRGCMSHVLQYALRISEEFPPSVILNSSFKLLEYVSKLPHDKDIKSVQNFTDKNLKAIFNIEQHSPKNFRHYKHTILNFLSSLMSYKHFVQQMGELRDEESSALKDVFSSIVEQCLKYIKCVSAHVETTGLSSRKYWQSVLGLCYDILDKTNALLPTKIFIGIVGRLLKHPMDTVRRKAMELLGWRLQQPIPLPQSQLRKLLDPLLKALDSLEQGESMDIEEGEEQRQESLTTYQASLYALKLMARHLATGYLEDFKKVLEKVSKILERKDELERMLLGSTVLCLGELVFVLKAHSIALLPTYMPLLISILHKAANPGGGGDLLILSTLTAIYKVVDTLAAFMSPYLEKLLYEISTLSAKNEMLVQAEPQLKAPHKLKLIRQKISSDVPTRVLVPAVSAAHACLMKNGQHGAIGILMSILSDSFTSASDLRSETVELFLSALEFRSSRPEPTLEQSDSVETPVMNALTSLVLKLSESSFRPLFQKIFDWATRPKGKKDRIISFYRLSSKIAKSLKSLFPLFIGIFIENAAEMLKLNNFAKVDSPYFDDQYGMKKSILLVDSIIETFLTAFTYDASQKFLSRDYFNLIMEPLVDQLENRMGDDKQSNERCKNLITPCLAEMANSTIDDSLWKRLNHHILLKTRHNLPEVRIIAMRTTCALAAKLGEGFMALLPETVPFLAELLEDDVEEVENECQKVVNEMEEILGESIQKYF